MASYLQGQRPVSATPRHGLMAWNRDAVAGFAAAGLLDGIIEYQTGPE